MSIFVLILRGPGAGPEAKRQECLMRNACFQLEPKVYSGGAERSHLEPLGARKMLKCSTVDDFLKKPSFLLRGSSLLPVGFARGPLWRPKKSSSKIEDFWAPSCHPLILGVYSRKAPGEAHPPLKSKKRPGKQSLLGSIHDQETGRLVGWSLGQWIDWFKTGRRS